MRQDPGGSWGGLAPTSPSREEAQEKREDKAAFLKGREFCFCLLFFSELIIVFKTPLLVGTHQ